jgi:hypothetical protein
MGGALALVIVPPLIDLNHMKPLIETAIFEQTGMNAKIGGNVNFSLLGGATVVVRDVTLADSWIDRVMFSIPVSKIFDMASAPLTGDIFIYGALLNIDALTPPTFGNDLHFKNSVVRFKGKDYTIAQGHLSGGLLRGVVRTSQHKYEFGSDGDEFHITNKTNNLDIYGRLYSDGSARGTLSIDTRDVNAWFEFDEPKISQRIKLAMDFDWNGDYGFEFSNIRGDNFSGRISLFEDGGRRIALTATDIDFDLSFLLGPTGVFRNTAFDLDLRGRLKFADKHFQHIEIEAAGTASEVAIKRIAADDITIEGGIINARGAENMRVRMTLDGQPTYCLFSGSPESWKCSEFSQGDLTGSLSVSDGSFEVFVQSGKKMPDAGELSDKTAMLGSRGRINFQFSDIGGTMVVDRQKSSPAYQFAKNKTLGWIGMDFGFMSDSMKSEAGDFVWDGDGMSFVPHSGKWRLSVSKDFFHIVGKNAKDWLPNADLRSLNDSRYEVSGNYKKGVISNLEIKIAGHVFRGSATSGGVTLATDLLNVDSFLSQDFADDYDELQFLSPEPLTIPFLLGANVSLSAKRIIFNGDEFANFVYSLRGDVQSFSITDSRRGNLLVGITREKNKYDILLQLNKFSVSGELLSSSMPFGIAGTTITGQAELNTSGQIAHTVWSNMSGHIDMSFEGGYVRGLGIDGFYANAANITALNAEMILAAALDGGRTALKSLRIIGDYDGGNFATSRPFQMSVRHADATGALRVNGGATNAEISIILRGTSPAPAPIEMKILPDGRRSYSLSQIMTGFDPDFFRDFAATHEKF